jgi:hypothetical protein
MKAESIRQKEKVPVPVRLFPLVRAFGAALLVSLACAGPVLAQTPAPQAEAAEALRAEMARLRQEFETLRGEYGARISAIESRIAALEKREPQPVSTEPVAPPPTVAQAPPPAPVPPTTPPTEAQVPPGAAGAGGPTGALPIYGSQTLLSKIFNPDVAVIGNFFGAAGKNEIDERPAFVMEEAEASFQAIVDPYARADFFFALSPEGVEIEEGYVTFPTLPGGFLMKAGKVKAQFGKENTLHLHQKMWPDAPLVLTNLLGGEEGFADSGVSVSRLILNPWVFLEATGEVYRGESELFRSFGRDDLAWVGRLRGYRDLTESMNVDLGTSVAWGRNELGEDASTRLVGVDATLRWRPLRRAIYRRFLGRTELMWNRASGLGEDEATAFGFYAGGEYQFARRWFAGARYDYSERMFDPALDDKGGSLLLTYWPSEFSQLRGQYRRTRYAESVTANEFLFQIQFSIGAHGAHAF